MSEIRHSMCEVSRIFKLHGSSFRGDTRDIHIACCYPMWWPPWDALRRQKVVLCIISMRVHALPLRVAPMPAVRYDLNGGLPTCIRLIIYQEYMAILYWCVFVNLIWYLYLFWLNKHCLSRNLSDISSDSTVQMTDRWKYGWHYFCNIVDLLVKSIIM